MAREQMVGATPEEFAAWAATAERPPTFGRASLHSLAAVAGLTVTGSETSTRPEVATAPVECRQQLQPRQRHQTTSLGANTDTRTNRVSLHLRSAFPVGFC